MPEPNSSVPPPDLWDPQKKQEQDYLRPRMVRIDQLERATALATRCMALRNQPGYQDFVKCMEDLHTAAMGELVSCSGDSAKVHTLQGKVQAYQNVLNVMKNTEKSRDTLAAQLKAAQDEVETMVDPTSGRPIPSMTIWS